MAVEYRFNATSIEAAADQLRELLEGDVLIFRQKKISIIKVYTSKLVCRDPCSLGQPGEPLVMTVFSRAKVYHKNFVSCFKISPIITAGLPERPF